MATSSASIPSTLPASLVAALVLCAGSAAHADSPGPRAAGLSAEPGAGVQLGLDTGAAMFFGDRDDGAGQMLGAASLSQVRVGYGWDSGLALQALAGVAALGAGDHTEFGGLGLRFRAPRRSAFVGSLSVLPGVGRIQNARYSYVRIQMEVGYSFAITPEVSMHVVTQGGGSLVLDGDVATYGNFVPVMVGVTGHL